MQWSYNWFVNDNEKPQQIVFIWTGNYSRWAAEKPYNKKERSTLKGEPGQVHTSLKRASYVPTFLNIEVRKNLKNIRRESRKKGVKDMHSCIIHEQQWLRYRRWSKHVLGSK